MNAAGNRVVSLLDGRKLSFRALRILLVLLLIAMLKGPGVSQSQAQEFIRDPQTDYRFGSGFGSTAQALANRRRMVQLRRLHQQEMTSDVVKLLSLANALQRQAQSGAGDDPGNKDKAKQIEKLAKEVRFLMEDPL